MVAMWRYKCQLVFFIVVLGFAANLQSLSTQGEAKSLPVNLDQAIHLQSKKYAKSKCVVAVWRKLESGSRIFRYSVAFRNSLSEVMAAGIGYNIWKMEACNSKTYAAITNVELTISFEGTSKTVVAKVSEVPTNAPVLTTSSTSSDVNDAGIAALALLFGIIFIFAAYISLRSRMQHCMRK